MPAEDFASSFSNWDSDIFLNDWKPLGAEMKRKYENSTAEIKLNFKLFESIFSRMLFLQNPWDWKVFFYFKQLEQHFFLNNQQQWMFVDTLDFRDSCVLWIESWISSVHSLIPKFNLVREWLTFFVNSKQSCILQCLTILKYFSQLWDSLRSIGICNSRKIARWCDKNVQRWDKIAHNSALSWISFSTHNIFVNGMKCCLFQLFHIIVTSCLGCFHPKLYIFPNWVVSTTNSIERNFKLCHSCIEASNKAHCGRCLV